MAIEESKTSTGWEIKATGKDIPKLKGMLTETANEAYKKAFHKNEGNWERITDQSGNVTVCPKDKIDDYLAAGYGRAPATATITVNGLGTAKRDGIIRYKSGKNWRETWYSDGRHVREDF